MKLVLTEAALDDLRSIRHDRIFSICGLRGCLNLGWRLLDLGELEAVFPELDGISVGDVGTQEVASFAAACDAQGLTVAK